MRRSLVDRSRSTGLSQVATAFFLVMLFCSCATTSVQKAWKSPDYHAGPMTKIAAIAVDERNLLRQGFENRIVKQLKERGASALVTYDLLSLPQIKENKQAAADQFRASGADALLILRLVNITSSYQDIQPGGERYAAVATGISPGIYPSWGWYDYYGVCYDVAFVSMSPVYGTSKTRVYLEASLFDLKTSNCIWSGISQSVFKETTDRVAEMDPIVDKLLAAMSKDGVIP